MANILDLTRTWTLEQAADRLGCQPHELTAWLDNFNYRNDTELTPSDLALINKFWCLED